MSQNTVEKTPTASVNMRVDSPREFDIIVFGASGMTGECLTVSYYFIIFY